MIDLFLIEGSFWSLFDLIFFVVQSMCFDNIKPVGPFHPFSFSEEVRRTSLNSLLLFHSLPPLSDKIIGFDEMPDSAIVTHTQKKRYFKLLFFSLPSSLSYSLDKTQCE